jgi:hypothetical protein
MASRRRGGALDRQEPPMSAIGSLLSSYALSGSDSGVFKSINSGITAKAAATRQGPLVNVDAKDFVGTWSGNWGKEGAFSLQVLSVTGYAAKVVYKNGSTVQASTVLIRDKAIRIGDVKITMDGTDRAVAKTVFTNPYDGGLTTVTAQATRAS